MEVDYRILRAYDIQINIIIFAKVGIFNVVDHLHVKLLI